MDSLFALPIKGESFLLRRGQRHILVDGGGSLRRLSDSGLVLSRALGTICPTMRSLDIAICTHADGDHAAGLATLLDQWRVPDGIGGTKAGRVGQFWLPGCWVDVIPELMRAPETFFKGLIAELDQLARTEPDLVQWDGTEDSLEKSLRTTDGVSRYINPEQSSSSKRADQESASGAIPADGENDRGWGTTEQLGEPDWFKELRQAATELIPERSKALVAFESARRAISYRRAKSKIGTVMAQFWLGLIEAAASIRGIADQAIKHRVPVRWFDFGEFERERQSRGGIPGFLVPINAVEQSRPPSIGLSYLARLSVTNEASLVFFAPPTLRHLGVLFCGDSPLGDGVNYSNSFLQHIPSPPLPILATAPHHGSQSNAGAYGHAERWAEVQVWLRTGGTKLHPGPAFKQIDFPRRHCTHCPQNGRPLQLATISGRSDQTWWGNLWILGHQCVCT
jgi:hypothetical protein